MKAILILMSALIMLASCTAVTVPNSPKAENFNLSQAKSIIASQKKVRKHQMKLAKKHRKNELKEIRMAYK